MKFPWPIAPDSSSAYEISAVKSKFRDIGGEAWPTKYNIIGGQCTGRRGFIATGASAYCFVGTYITTEHGGDEYKCAFHLPPADIRDIPGQIVLDMVNTNLENQAGIVGGSAFLNQYGPLVEVRHSGTLEFPNGAIFTSNAGGAYGSFQFATVTGVGTTPIFDLDQAAPISISGVYQGKTPGALRGGCAISMANIDWNLRAWDPAWVAFLGANLLAPASTTAGMIAPRAAVIVPGGGGRPPIAADGSATAQLALSLNLPQAFSAWTGGRQTLLKLTLKAGLLAAPHGLRSLLRSRISFGANGSGAVRMYLRQTATGVSIPLTAALSISTGQSVTFDITLEDAAGAGFGRAAILAFVNTQLAAHTVNFNPGGYDVGRDGTLEFDATTALYLGPIEAWMA